MPRTLTPKSLVAVLRLGGKVECQAHYAGSRRILNMEPDGTITSRYANGIYANQFDSVSEMLRNDFYYSFKLCPEPDNNNPENNN